MILHPQAGDPFTDRHGVFVIPEQKHSFVEDGHSMAVWSMSELVASDHLQLCTCGAVAKSVIRGQPSVASLAVAVWGRVG